MGGGKMWLRRMADETGIIQEGIPGVPVVELLGDRQVLVENHRGVSEYSAHKIGVKVKYGVVAICGCDLELKQVAKDQLVISGRVDCVSVLRRRS